MAGPRKGRRGTEITGSDRQECGLGGKSQQRA
jgi:hypothetical protein